MKPLSPIVKIAIVVVVLVVAVFASLWEINVLDSAPVQLAPSGWDDNDCNVQCSLTFYTDTGGQLAGSWQTGNALQPSNSTASLYPSDSAGAPLGPPDWTGTTNAPMDSMSIHVGEGTYTLEWNVPRSQSPAIVTMTSELSMTPPAPFPWL